MPVYDSAGSRVVHFGVGDILISKGQNVDKTYSNEILLIADDRENIPNTRIPDERHAAEFAGRTSDTLNCPVRLIFDKVSALDALIIEMMELRVEMAMQST